MPIRRANLFDNENIAPSTEVIQTLLTTGGFRLERVVSNGSATPKDEWYDQGRAEWVILLKGRARLRFKNPDMEVELFPGDHMDIPAHQLHRVEWTHPDEQSVWLALHYSQ